MVANSTAPAEISFTKPAFLSNWGENKSTNFSIEVLKSSAQITKPIENIIPTHSKMDRDNIMPEKVTIIAAKKWNLKFLSVWKAFLIPLKAQQRLFHNFTL